MPDSITKRVLFSERCALIHHFRRGMLDTKNQIQYNPVFDTLKKIKLLHPLIYKRCSSLSPSFNI